MNKWLWLTVVFGALTIAAIPLVNRADDSYLIITLECESGTFSQEYVDSVNFHDEGNYFWAGSSVDPGDFNLDGKLSMADIVGIINRVFKGDSLTTFVPSDTGIAIYYNENGTTNKIKFIKKVK